jgi:hypothetical protein
MFRKFKNYLFGTMPNPADATLFYNGAGGFTAPVGSGKRQITVPVDGGGVVITTGIKATISMPVAGTFTKWRVLSCDAAATAGSIVFDIWKDSYVNYPPTIADTITAAAKPTLSAVNKNESTALGTWVTTFAAGDIFIFNVDSAATVTKVLLVLEFQ